MAINLKALEAMMDETLKNAPMAKVAGQTIEPTEEDRQIAASVWKRQILFSSKNVPVSPLFDGVNVDAVNVVLKQDHNFFLRATNDENDKPVSYRLRPAITRKKKTAAK